MKTEIILTYNPDKDHVISRVLPLSNDGFVVLTRQSDHWSLNIHGRFHTLLDWAKEKTAVITDKIIRQGDTLPGTTVMKEEMDKGANTDTIERKNSQQGNCF